MFTALTDEIAIDRARRCVMKGDKEIHLTGLEYGLLDYLTAHPNRLCTRQELLDHVWGSRFHYDPGTIDVHLNALRRKMGWSSNAPIQTVRGAGLLFHLAPDTFSKPSDLLSILDFTATHYDVMLKAAGISLQLELTPYVNELTIDADSLKKMLDSAMEALIAISQPGVLRIATKLTLHHFKLSMECNGTIWELRIPLKEI